MALEKLTDSIESKLKENPTSLNTSDITLLKCIIESSHKIWELSKTYPELDNEIGIKFKEMFEDMCSHICTKSTESNYTYLCEYCDLDIPLLNNNPEFSFQMHLQTSEHVENINNFKELYLSAHEVTDVGNDLYILENTEEKPQKSEVMKFIRKVEKENKLVNRVDSSNESSSSNDIFLSDNSSDNDQITGTGIVKNGQKYCNLCEVWLPNNGGDTHCNGRQHIARARGWIERGDKHTYCKICKVKFKGRNYTRNLVKHFNSRQHRKQSVINF